MANVSNEKLSKCKNYIGSACLAAQASLPVLMEFFKYKKTNIIEHSNEDTILVEIAFEAATLTCVIDSDEMSKGAFLFFNHSPDIIDFIEYCNNSFPYDFFLQSWTTINCYIQVHTVNKVSCLAIIPASDEPSSRN